ncbi:MAG: hypothetical protein SGI98_03340 [Verrucomicrobiota bacterium]|nr:hypothetical protein [Verrucomicrobiota bacterium]
MDRKNGIEIAGRVLDVMNERLAEIEFPNQHKLVGFIEPPDMEKFKNRLVQGAQVIVICSSFDFSKGRIIKIE